MTKKLTKKQLKALVGKWVWFKKTDEMPRECLKVVGLNGLITHGGTIEFEDENGDGGNAFIEDIETINGEPHIQPVVEEID